MNEDGDRVLIMRASRADGTSRGGFPWPAEGYVEAPIWSADAVCGDGLHGWLWGEGDVSMMPSEYADGRWMIVEALAVEVVDLGGKVKFPRGWVVASGARAEIIAEMCRRCVGRAVMYGTATAGARGVATAGDYGTATVGDRGTATAGYRGTATVGARGTATAGDRGTATAGYGGRATARDYGTATVGDRGTATAGYGGTATARDYGTATVGDRGTATVGDRGTATVGDRGTATAGDYGTIVSLWYDGVRYRLAVGYIGEDGLCAGVAYRCDGGRFVEVTR